MAAASSVLWFADAFPSGLAYSTACSQSKLTQNWPRSSKKCRPVLEISWNVCHQGSRRAGSTARRLHFSTQLPTVCETPNRSLRAHQVLHQPCWAHSRDGSHSYGTQCQIRSNQLQTWMSTPARSPAGSGSPAAVSIHVPQLDSSCKLGKDGSRAPMPPKY